MRRHLTTRIVPDRVSVRRLRPAQDQPSLIRTWRLASQSWSITGSVPGKGGGCLRFGRQVAVNRQGQHSQPFAGRPAETFVGRGQTGQEQIECLARKVPFVMRGTQHYLLQGIRDGPVEKIGLFLVPVTRGMPHPRTGLQNAVRRRAAILLQEILNTVDDHEGRTEILIGL